MSFPLRPTGGGSLEHEERAEELGSSQRVRDHLVAYDLAPAITHFILDDSEHRECCNNKFEQALTLLHSAKSSTKIKYSKQGNTQSIFYSL